MLNISANISHRRVRPLLLAILLLVCHFAVAQQSNSDDDDLILMIPAIIAATATPNIAPRLRELFDLHNKARSSERTCGTRTMPAVKSLRWNKKLALAAQRHAKDLQNLYFFSHTGSDGSTTAERVADEGYNWELVGQNMARDQLTPAAVMQKWLTHAACRNIMTSEFRHIGIAEFQPYWVVVLGDIK